MRGLRLVTIYRTRPQSRTLYRRARSRINSLQTVDLHLDPVFGRTWRGVSGIVEGGVHRFCQKGRVDRHGVVDDLYRS